MFKNILIFGHSNIGDVCYDLAVVDPLRKKFPQARITFLTTARCKGIVDGYKGIDKIIIFDRKAKNKSFVSQLQFIFILRKEKFDLTVVLKKSLRYKFLGIPEVWRVEGNGGSQQKHLVDSYLKLLCDHGVEVGETFFSSIIPYILLSFK